jgi:SAM-dependent methyltransferase
MRCTRVARRTVWSLCLVLLIAPVVYGQAQTQGKGYTPKEGQPGKDVIWLPSAQRLVDKMLDLANVTPKDYVIDLGSGDGRTVITAAKRGARALGIEFNPDLVELSKRLAAKEGVADRAKFIKGDVFESDFSQATVITMFLLPELNLKLRPQILSLKPGTRVVSNTFPMGDWTPDETVDVEGQCSSYCTALLWIVPARVEGRWKLSQGELALTQNHQVISGTLTSQGRSVPIANGQLRGEQVSFTAGNAQYTGHVRNNGMQGEFKIGGRNGTWSAIRID